MPQLSHLWKCRYLAVHHSHLSIVSIHTIMRRPLATLCRLRASPPVISKRNLHADPNVGIPPSPSSLQPGASDIEPLLVRITYGGQTTKSINLARILLGTTRLQEKLISTSILPALPPEYEKYFIKRLREYSHKLPIPSHPGVSYLEKARHRYKIVLKTLVPSELSGLIGELLHPNTSDLPLKAREIDETRYSNYHWRVPFCVTESREEAESIDLRMRTKFPAGIRLGAITGIRLVRRSISGELTTLWDYTWKKEVDRGEAPPDRSSGQDDFWSRFV